MMAERKIRVGDKRYDVSEVFTHVDIGDIIAKEQGKSFATTRLVTRIVFDTVKRVLLKTKQPVHISGFGTFILVKVMRKNLDVTTQKEIDRSVKWKISVLGSKMAYEEWLKKREVTLKERGWKWVKKPYTYRIKFLPTRTFKKMLRYIGYRKKYLDS